MGRNSNTGSRSLVSSDEGSGGNNGTSTVASPYLSNFPPMPSAASNLHEANYVPNHHPHYQLPPSPPIHPHQYINMGHLTSAAAQAQLYFEATNSDNNCTGGGGAAHPNSLTPPTRGFSPMSHGSNSSNGGSSSALSYVSSASVGGGNTGSSSGPITIMETINVTGNNSGGNVKFDYDDFPHEPDGGPVKINTWKDHIAVFNMDQVGVMCDVLLQEGDTPRLVDLLATVAKDFIGRSEKILRAQAHIAFQAALNDPRKFPQVYKILETNSFSSQYHAGLQKLWFNAHYKEAEITRGRPLGAVDKYRIRRKFPLPRTIWDGEETVYCFKERSRNALRQSFILEKYPNLEEKKKLSKETGLTMTQVGNWFKNKRQREKEKMQGKAIAKRSKPPYNTSSALAASIAPDILGMMLNPGAVNQTHLHHHQAHIAPLSSEELENALRRAKYEEARIKTYIDDNIYHHHQPSQASLSQSNLQSYLHHHHHQIDNGTSPNNVINNNNNNATSKSPHPHHMVLPGKSDITVGLVRTPTISSNNQQREPSPRSSIGNGGGLTITAIPSSDSNTEANASPQGGVGDPDTSPGKNRTDDGGGDVFGGGALRSRIAFPGHSALRCESDLVPNVHPAHHSHSHHHHSYNHHYLHHSHHNHSSVEGGYDSGFAPLIHPHV